MMKGIAIGLAFGVAVVALDRCAHGAEQRRFYDDRGRSVGTASTDSQGTTTFYDARGRVAGKATQVNRGGK
jgi:YD repeat-containing protein